MPINSPLSENTLAILAGGEGARMGRPKGLLTIGGAPILRFLLERIRWPGPTLLVTAPGREHPPGWEEFDRESVDPVAGEGPLRGVLTALQTAATSRVIVATVDMPGIGMPQLEWLATAFDREQPLGMMMCRHDATQLVTEPFPLMVARDAADVIRSRIESQNRSVHGLLDDSRFVAVSAPPEWDSDIWTNLNRPADFERFCARLRTRAEFS